MSVDFAIDLLRAGGVFHHQVNYDPRTQDYICTVDRFPGLQFVADGAHTAMRGLMRIIRRIVYARDAKYQGLAEHHGTVPSLGAFRYTVVWDLRDNMYVCTVDRFPGPRFVAADPRDAVEGMTRVMDRIIYSAEERRYDIADQYGVSRPLGEMADRATLIEVARQQ